MNDGKFLHQLFLTEFKAKRNTAGAMAKEAGVARTTLYKLFKVNVIDDFYKNKIEKNLGIKFPKPNVKTTPAFQNNQLEIDFKILESKYKQLLDENKLLRESNDAYKKQYE